MMISCKRASELNSKSMDEELGLYERTALRFHNAICLTCRNFLSQLKILRSAIRSGELFDKPVPPAAKQRVLERVEREVGR